MRRQGPLWPNHVGRGPRNYRRTDERIHEDVCERLTDDPRVDAFDIEVRVKDGEVTLAGNVTLKIDQESPMTAPIRKVPFMARLP